MMHEVNLDEHEAGFPRYSMSADLWSLIVMSYFTLALFTFTLTIDAPRHFRIVSECLLSVCTIS